MARNTITIPITKSSNSDRRIIVPPDIQQDSFLPGAVTNILYMQKAYYFAEYLNNIGLAWEQPEWLNQKVIINTTIHLYSRYRYRQAMIYQQGEFSEGSEIPRVTSADGSIGDGLYSGWNEIIIPKDLKGSIILEQANRINGSVNEWAEIHSSRNSNNKPYVTITYDDVPPEKPSSLYPSGITLNPRDVIRFSWLHNSKENLQQKGFTLEYSTNGGGTWTKVIQTTPNQYYDMPANTLPSTGIVMWRVKTLDDNNSESEYSTASFTLGVVPQKAPIPISPISQYLDENKPIRFEWSFVGGSPSETQSKFDLQYSTNGGSSWTTKTLTTNNNYYELPANTFSGGNVTWRVRTYNNWNEVSPYSENKSFTVIGSPPIPLISSVSNSARPLVSWQSTNQHIYELEILQGNKVIFEASSIPSTSDRSFKLPIYLTDGTYIAKLRIANEYSLYSPWAEKSFIISTVKPTKPIMSIYSGEYGVTIKTSDTSLKTLVYRDNIYIGEVINNHFIDYTGENNKEYQYFVRTIDSNDNFSDSDIKLAKCKFRGNTLSSVSDLGNFIKLRTGLNSNPKKINQFGVVGTLQYFDGREYPIVEFSEFSNRTKSLSFFVRTIEELENIVEMIKKRETFLYRNSDGKNIHGTILEINYDENETFFGYEIGFTITQTDYRGVSYD
ncbi:hypothetical protein [Tissierella sp.]|uniref:hypothetical protein n=1 Tax=Tissierella sp. TaxID=41274 RepID=UPI0030373E2D